MQLSVYYIVNQLEEWSSNMLPIAYSRLIQKIYAQVFL